MKPTVAWPGCLRQFKSYTAGECRWHQWQVLVVWPDQARLDPPLKSIWGGCPNDSNQLEGEQKHKNETDSEDWLISVGLLWKYRLLIQSTCRQCQVKLIYCRWLWGVAGKTWQNATISQLLTSSHYWLVVWLPFFIFPEILGISSSQLTNSYFSEGWPNHQPD